MEITIYQMVCLKPELKVFHDVYKTFESDVIPHKGDLITDTAFKDPYEYEVVEVTLNYQYNSCSVRLSMIELESSDKKAVKDHIQMMQLHDWKCNTLDLL